MRTISCKLEDLKNMTLHIGYEGENDYTSVRIDAGSVFAEYPEAVATMKVHPPKGNLYPVIVSREGDIVVWNVKDSDTASNGNGEIQLTFTEGSVIRKSCTAKTLVHRSLKTTGPAPDPLEDWIEQAEEVLDDLEAMDTIAKNAQAGDIGKALSPKTVENGVVTEWQYVEQGGGTEDYSDLENKPSIAGVTLSGDKSLADLGIASAESVSELSGDVADVKSGIQGVNDDLDDAVFFEETQDDDSIEEIIKSEIIDKMKFSLSGVDLSIVYDGTVIDTVQLPSAQPVPCTGVALDITVTALEAEKTVTLTATLTPSNTTDTVVWSTSDDTVATVSNGVVTGVAKGTATITVTCGSFSDTCTVTVTAYFRELVLGYLLTQTNRLDYRSSYGYKSGGTFNDPFLKKVLSGQKVSLRNTVLVGGLYVYMYVYASGTFTDKCTKVGDDYVLTQAMLDMQSNDTYGILVSSERLSSYGQYASLWEGDFTAEQDCYVAFFYNINGVNDISDRLDDIKNAIRIEVE